MTLFSASGGIDTVDNIVNKYNLNSAWEHLPILLQKKFVNLENMKSMFPLKGTLRDDDTNSQDPVELSIEGDSENITFVINCLDSDNNVLKKNSVHFSFKNKKWFSTIMINDSGEDFISTAESPLFGNMSNTDIMNCTQSAIDTICNILD